MTNITTIDAEEHNIDPATLERALRSASLDLQQIIVTVARRHLDSGRRAAAYGAQQPTWQTLRTIDEQTFENPGFIARHNDAVRSMFVRFGDSRLSAFDLDAPVDWRHDDDNLPVVYLLVRALVESSGSMNE